jgi:RHS repeat-associated protein
MTPSLMEINAISKADERHLLHKQESFKTGSSSFITDVNGDATQHLQYACTEPVECVPFGEDFVWSLSGVEGHQQNTAAYFTPYTFSGKERDVETGLSYFGARYYEAGLSVWLSVDPMSDKYPHESSFAYAGNSPVIFVDPDGREKILALDKNKDKAIIAGAQKYKDDNAIHVFAHGSSKGMSVVINGKTTRIRTAKQLDKFLTKNSSTWQKREDGDQVAIILHSCNTGRDDKDGTESFAEKVSKSDIFKDATIIAPNERVYFSESGEVGTYEAEYANEHGEYKRDANGEVKCKSRSENTGSWRIFQGGKRTGQFRGDWHPKEQPTTWDNLTKREL